VDIQIELQAFRLLFQLNHDRIAKDHFFRPTHPVFGDEWDTIVSLFHSMEYAPFDHYIIVIESLIQLIHPDHFCSVPHQRYQFIPRLLAHLKKVSVNHLASATPPASNTAQDLAFRSYASSDATTNRYAESERVAHITPRRLTSDIATTSDSDIIQDRTLSAAAPNDPSSDSEVHTDDIGDMENNNTATVENNNDIENTINTASMANDHDTATLENENATLRNDNTTMENTSNRLRADEWNSNKCNKTGTRVLFKQILLDYLFFPSRYRTCFARNRRWE